MQSKGHLRVFSTPQFKSIKSLALSFLYSPTLTSIHYYWKNHSFDKWTFVGKVMSLLFNMLSRLVWKAAVHAVTEGRTRLSDFTFTFHFHCIGEGNGNPLQGSCLENPRDGGAWWAAVYGVAQSWTQLKRLSSSSSATEVFPG